jgi:hypothetical protein
MTSNDHLYKVHIATLTTVVGLPVDSSSGDIFKKNLPKNSFAQI